jgi:hypothetical protein
MGRLTGGDFTKASTPLLSYSITPRQVKRLHDLLASGQKVLHATSGYAYVCRSRASEFPMCDCTVGRE